MINQKEIDRITAKLPRDKVLYCWSGVVFDLRSEVIRADKLFLNVVRPGRDGAWLFWRIAPQMIPASDTSNNHVEYSLDLRFRITNGNRRGQVMPFADIRDGETWKSAGVQKELVIGDEAYMLRLRNPGDRFTLRLLSGIPENPEDALWAPELLLTTPENKAPKLRQTTAAYEYLRGFPCYDNLLNPTHNASRVIPEIKQHVRCKGETRDAYPYKYFEGRGVLAVRPEGIGEWRTTQELQSKEEELAIQ